MIEKKCFSTTKVAEMTKELFLMEVFWSSISARRAHKFICMIKLQNMNGMLGHQVKQYFNILECKKPTNEKPSAKRLEPS